jgi:hypothetical protein
MESKGLPVEIRLLGQKIALRSQGDPDLVREVVEVVTRKIGDAERRRGKGSAAHHVALLALLDLAQEHVQARKRAGEHQTRLDLKARELSELIEAEFR